MCKQIICFKWFQKIDRVWLGFNLIVDTKPVEEPPFNSLLINIVNPNTVQHCTGQYSQTIQTKAGQYNNEPSTVFTINDSQSEVSTVKMPKILNIHLSTFDNLIISRKKEQLTFINWKNTDFQGLIGQKLNQQR